MHQLGMRGYRMSTVVGGGVGFDRVRHAGAREAREMGWHLVLHFKKSSELVDLAPACARSRSTWCWDHLARIRADEGIDSPAFRALVSGLMDTGRGADQAGQPVPAFQPPLSACGHAADDPRGRAALAGPFDLGSNWPHPICDVPDAERWRSGGPDTAVDTEDAGAAARMLGGQSGALLYGF